MALFIAVVLNIVVHGSKFIHFLKAGLIGAAFQGVFGAIGDRFREVTFLSAEHLSKSLAHDLAGGLQSVVSGGKFGHGFIGAGAAQFAAPGISTIGKGAKAYRGVRVAVAGIVGGATSSALGGNFAAGAFSAAFARQFNDEKHIDDNSDPVVRTLKTLKAYGRVAAGGLQITAGKGMCATVALCTIGAPLLAQGAGNVGGGVSDYLEVLGVESNFNITERLYDSISPGNGRSTFVAVDIASGLGGFAASFRQVPVVLRHQSLPITAYTTAPAYRVQGTPLPDIVNDAGQITLSYKGITEK